MPLFRDYTESHKKKSIVVGAFGLILLLIFLIGIWAFQKDGQPTDTAEYYRRVLISLGDRSVYQALFLSPDQRTLFFRNGSYTYLLDLHASKLYKIDLSETCDYLRPLNESVLVCATTSLPSHPTPILYRYPSFQRIFIEPDNSTISREENFMFFIRYASSSNDGLLNQGDKWYFINRDALEPLDSASVQTLYGDGNVQRDTPILSPDQRHYFVFGDETLAVYTTNDDKIQWEMNVGGTHYVPGWRYDSCALIYYYLPTWDGPRIGG